MKKGFYVNHDDNTNRGVEYEIINGEVIHNSVVETGKNKKPMMNVPGAVTILTPRRGTLKDSAKPVSYTSIYGHGTVSGNVVRYEDTPEKLIIVVNQDDTYIEVGEKIYSVSIGRSLCYGN